MTSNTNLIVTLFKSSPSNADTTKDSTEAGDKFQSAVTNAGYSCQVIHTLAFQYCNLQTLAYKLLQPDQYSGIIFTSPRCVSAVQQSLELICQKDSESKLKSKWSQRKLYCVGQSTAEIVAQMLNVPVDTSNIVTSEKGNAESLGQAIVADALTSSYLLYPCGNLKTQTLSQVLDAHSVSYDLLTVYETVPNSELEKLSEFIKKVNEDKSDLLQVLVFFSPSGVQFCQKFLSDICNSSSCRFIAIGPSTLSALKSLPTKPENTLMCDYPSPESLTSVLSSLTVSS